MIWDKITGRKITRRKITKCEITGCKIIRRKITSCKIIRRLAVAAAVIVGLCLSACSGKRQASLKTPEEAVEAAMEALKTLDMDTFNGYTDNYVATRKNWLGMPVEREYRVFSELQQPGVRQGSKYEANRAFAEKIVENLTWEIGRVNMEGDQAEISVRITNTDMSDVVGYYTIHVMETMIEGKGTGLGNLFHEVAEADYNRKGILPYLEAAEGNVTTEVTVKAYMEDGMWKIMIDDPFIEAFMGTFGSGNFSEEVNMRLEEVEAEYERKMDRWGDEFGEQIGEWAEHLFE